MTASDGNQPGRDDQPPAQPPGTGDVVVTSPPLGAPWDYGPGTDLQGVQFHPRYRWPANRRRRGLTVR
jgi:hypothetical protein